MVSQQGIVQESGICSRDLSAMLWGFYSLIFISSISIFYLTFRPQFPTSDFVLLLFIHDMMLLENEHGWLNGGVSV